MASTTMIECSSLRPFNMADGESSSLGQHWNRWKRSFVAKGVSDALQKQALLLHLAGPEVQDIFDTLPQAEGEDVYEKTVNALSSYFNLMLILRMSVICSAKYSRTQMKQLTSLSPE